MRIGFDATAIPALRAGAGNYIYHLIHALSQVDRENEYFVFAQKTQVQDLQVSNKNFNVIAVPVHGRALRLLWEQVTLPRYVRQLRLALLHSPHYTMPLLAQVKSVVTFHDMTFFLFPHLHRLHYRVPFQNMIRWSADRADRIITVSDSTKHDTQRCLNVSPQKLITIPLAASTEFRPVSEAEAATFCERQRLEIRKYICFVGVLEPRKGISVLINAFAKLAKEFSDLTLVIAGKKGWMYDDIVAAAKNLGLSERVRFLGYLDETDLICLINGAKVFVYPSLYEGFGIPVLEAMQCGTPVITTNVSSLPEVAGDAALLVGPNDSEALVQALRQVLTQPELAKAMSERGMARAKTFEWKRTATETLSVYETVLNGGRSARVGHG